MRPQKHHRAKPATPSNALVPLSAGGTQIALPEALVASAGRFAKHSRAPSTRTMYAFWWKDFGAWCASNGRERFPITPNMRGMDPEDAKEALQDAQNTMTSTLIGYITYLAQGRGGTTKPLAPSSIDQAMAALKLAHSQAGYAWADSAWLKEVRKGIRRESAKTRTKRRVRPFTFAELRELLDMLRPDVLREVRDAAMLSLCLAGALRRSELVGLDYGVLGTNKDEFRSGVLTIDGTGKDSVMNIRLMTSKSSQDQAVDIPIPRDFAPIICSKVEAWIKLANIERGTPLFRSTTGGYSSAIPQSGFVGINHSRRDDKWSARSPKPEAKWLGAYDTIEEACAAYRDHVGSAPPKDKLAGTRLLAEIVATVIKRRMWELLEARNKRRGNKKLTREEMKAMVALYSGHSPRVGFATSAAEQDMPSHKIQNHMRHKTPGMTTEYIRPVADRQKSAIRGIAF